MFGTGSQRRSKHSLKIMSEKKNIFVIIGSARKNSTNEKLINHFDDLTKDIFSLKIFKDLNTLPHFNPELSKDNTPNAITEFRKNIENADGIIICTPEYVFSIPSGLKNGIEWCVSTTVFLDKPIGIITASADGEKGHEQLQLIMKTVMAKFTKETTLLIQGIGAKISEQGHITDYKTNQGFINFIAAFKNITN